MTSQPQMGATTWALATVIALSTGCTDRARETSADAGATASSSAITAPSPSASSAQGQASSSPPAALPPLRCPRGM
ncbi:MAG: hypothetical protein ACMG6S_19460, partial [Byssovorax sp.]